MEFKEKKAPSQVVLVNTTCQVVYIRIIDTRGGKTILSRDVS